MGCLLLIAAFVVFYAAAVTMFVMLTAITFLAAAVTAAATMLIPLVPALIVGIIKGWREENERRARDSNPEGD